MLKRFILKNFTYGLNSSAIVIKPPDFYEHYKLTNHIKNNINKIEEERKEKEKIFFDNKFNDKNKNNFIKVIINKNILENKEEMVTPFFIKKNPKKEKKIYKISMTNIPSSLKKLKPYLKKVSNQNIYGAISLLSSNDTKACKLLINALNKCLATALRYDMKPEQIFIHGIVAGKHMRKKRLYYHARGKHGIMNKDTTRLKLYYYEKSVEELFELFATGKTPTSLAYMLRKDAEEKEIPYHKIKEFSYLFTSKARQQKRLMIKRRAMQLKFYYQNKGYNISFKVLVEYINNKEKEKFIKNYKENFLNRPTKNLTERKRIFEENQKASL